MTFVNWRDTMEPRGDTMEEFEKFASLDAWDAAVASARELIQDLKDTGDIDSLEPGFRTCDHVKSLKEGVYSRYQKPPATGCGSSPAQAIESTMVHFWNTALKSLTLGLVENYRMDYPKVVEKIVERLNGLGHGNQGCGTCGAATGCGSK